MVEVLYRDPPMIDEIDAVFHVRGKPVIFCFGNVIFNPMRIALTRELGVHEATHSFRQGDAVEAWWRRYIDDPEFRYREELPAHIAEYGAFCEFHKSPKKRQRALHQISQRLASPLYGGLVSWADAKRQIREAA